MSLYEQTLDQLRQEHRVGVSVLNEWSCSCGRRGKTSPSTTHAVAWAGANRHLHAEHKRLIKAASEAAQ